MPPKAAAPPAQKSASRFGRVKSNLKMGIVGLPNVGKSSLFNLMCDMQVCTITVAWCTSTEKTHL